MRFFGDAKKPTEKLLKEKLAKKKGLKVIISYLANFEKSLSRKEGEAVIEKRNFRSGVHQIIGAHEISEAVLVALMEIVKAIDEYTGKASG